MGLKGIDLVGPKDWPTLKKYDLYSPMCNGAEINIPKGWNDKQYHQALTDSYSDMIPLVAAAGYKNLICFSGNRNGIDDQAAPTAKLCPACIEHRIVLQPATDEDGIR